MPIDFQSLKAANPIEQVVGRYVELKQRGSEYTGLCPFHNEKTPSFTVSSTKGFYHCHGCGKHGDVTDFIRDYEGVSFREAADMLGHEDRLPAARAALPAPVRDTSHEWAPLIPVPADAPAYDPTRTWNAKTGKWVRYSPTMSWDYRGADGELHGHVVRLEFDREGKKQKVTPTITYCRHSETGETRWATRPFPRPRAMYGAELIAQAGPRQNVVVVEGEKACAFARREMANSVVVTWAGGTNGVGFTDFSMLDGRNVVLWPDADGPGLKAMQEIASKIRPATLRWISTAGLEAGFDAADIMPGGVIEFVRARISMTAPPEPDPPPAPKVNGTHVEMAPVELEVEPVVRHVEHSEPPNDPPNDPPVDPPGDQDEPPEDPDEPGRRVAISAPPSQGELWQRMSLDRQGNGMPLPNLNNAMLVLLGMPDFRDAIWFDQFQQKILTNWQTDKPHEWTDGDDIELALYMQRIVGIVKMPTAVVNQAVNAVARRNTRNEVTAWLDTLTWDGVSRLETFLSDVFGAEQTEYTAAAGRNFWITIAARAYAPGCKVDNMLVLEGLQGLGKSKAFDIIGGRWFAEAHESVTSKDFFLALQGKLVVEIGEMDAFSRAETTRVKQVVTCRSDRFRAPYERATRDWPRQCVFVGTTNRDDWNRDETGARRFWPVKCVEVNVDAIKANRDQFFAEAVAAYKAGATWWEMPESAKAEQESRRQHDEWEPLVADFLIGKVRVTVGEILGGCLEVGREKWDRALQMRVASALRIMGWNRVDGWASGKKLKYWERGGKVGQEKLF